MPCQICQKLHHNRVVCSAKCLGAYYRLKGIRPPSRKGTHHTPEHARKIREAMEGRPSSMLRPEVVAKVQATKRRTFDLRGRRGTQLQLIRDSPAYKLWRKSVFERDNYTCVFCGQRGGQLQADHIKSFARFPELRFDLSNGRTLCKPCHKLTPTYGGRSRQVRYNSAMGDIKQKERITVTGKIKVDVFRAGYA
jgi:hypothetical protein